MMFRNVVVCLSALIGFSVLMNGCMWGRMQVNDPTLRERALAVRVDKTREADLRGILGAEPTMRMPLRNRTVLGYTYSDAKTHGLMLILFNFMKTQSVADTIYFELDGEGIVRRASVPPEREIEWKFWPF